MIVTAWIIACGSRIIYLRYIQRRRRNAISNDKFGDGNDGKEIVLYQPSIRTISHNRPNNNINSQTYNAYDVCDVEDVAALSYILERRSLSTNYTRFDWNTDDNNINTNSDNADHHDTCSGPRVGLLIPSSIGRQETECLELTDKMFGQPCMSSPSTERRAHPKAILQAITGPQTITENQGGDERQKTLMMPVMGVVDMVCYFM